MVGKKAPGADAERLVIEGDWESAVSKALGKKRPAGSWPERPTRTYKKRAKKKLPTRRKKKAGDS